MYLNIKFKNIFMSFFISKIEEETCINHRNNLLRSISK